MTRTLRQNKIIELISAHSIETQEELAEKLNKSGFFVTQATVSRDIKDLGLIKIIGENRRHRYSVVKSAEKKDSEKLFSLFKDSVLSINSSVNIIVVKTIAGSANTACAFIDNLNSGAIIGTVAGDDNILLVIDKIENVDIIMKKLNSYL